VNFKIRSRDMPTVLGLRSLDTEQSKYHRDWQFSTRETAG